MAYQEVYSPGYTVTVKTVSLEANLYEVENEKLVWDRSLRIHQPKDIKRICQ